MNDDADRLEGNIEALLEQIARRELKIHTLHPHRSGNFDTKEVSVQAIRRALRAAFMAGRGSSAKPE